eukprot:TRINITY_DN17944_c0_g1_i1.p1 TRINITY_DN17944_c0_g1~~TRINITY_DN17944_c0_g1_i1.p1  ORF type:complete len:253 (-),score=42.06 TRINITY_DN17944_c0_g1_i1:302-1060(-)
MYMSAARVVERMTVEPLARKLMAEEDPYNSDSESYEAHLLKRTLIGDNMVREAHAKGIRQVVLLGAGMDSRAFRLGFRDMDFFEVDKQALFDVKEPVLEGVPVQAARRVVVPCNLGRARLCDLLRNAGFDSSRPSCWLLEGLVMYLTAEELTWVASEVGLLAACGSMLWHDDLLQSRQRNTEVPAESSEPVFTDYSTIWKQTGFDRTLVLSEDLREDLHEKVLLKQTPLGRPKGRCLLVRAEKSMRAMSGCN